jgi:hypothetical protein
MSGGALRVIRDTRVPLSQDDGLRDPIGVDRKDGPLIHSVQARPWMLLAAAVGLALGAFMTVPMVAGAQEPPIPYSGEVPASGGVGLLIVTQDTSPGALSDALEAVGCDARSIATTTNGSWRVYIPGAPSFVNAGFSTLLPQGTVFALFCAAPYQEPTVEDAVALLEGYFTDLDAGRYSDAYAAWRTGSNPQTEAEFEAGYAHTTSVTANIGEPGAIDAGAGQRYIEIPVSIFATLDDGTVQHFEGTYVLHHTANIPGATAEQLTWHIRSATVTQTN